MAELASSAAVPTCLRPRMSVVRLHHTIRNHISVELVIIRVQKTSHTIYTYLWIDSTALQQNSQVGLITYANLMSRQTARYLSSKSCKQARKTCLASEHFIPVKYLIHHPTPSRTRPLILPPGDEKRRSSAAMLAEGESE